MRSIVCVLMMLVSSPGWCDTFETGNTLKSKLLSQEELVQAIAYGYIVGVSDTLNTDGILGFRACVPLTTKEQQLKDIVFKWLIDHPDKLQFSAHAIVALALFEAFPPPCRK